MMRMTTSNNQHFVLKRNTGVTDPSLCEVLKVNPVTSLLEADTALLLVLMQRIIVCHHFRVTQIRQYSFWETVLCNFPKIHEQITI